MITSAVYVNAENTSLLATLDTGAIWLMPQPCESYHKEYLDVFLDGGGTIDPYEAPAPTTAAVDLSQRISDLEARVQYLETQTS